MMIQMLAIPAMLSVAIQTAPEPDLTTLIPEVIDAVIEYTVYPQEGGYPADAAIGLNFATVAREFRKIRTADVNPGDIVRAVTKHRVEGWSRRPWCESDTKCEQRVAGRPPILVSIVEMEKRGDGYFVRVSWSQPGYFASYGFLFTWKDDHWERELSGNIIRS